MADNNVNAEKLKTIYQHLWYAHGGGVYEKLNQSLHPRSPNRMEPKQIGRIGNALGLVFKNLSSEYVENCFKDANLQIFSSEVIGSELSAFGGRQKAEGRRQKAEGINNIL